MKGVLHMCEYGISCSCRQCRHAIREDVYVVGCLLEEEELQREEEMMRSHTDDEDECCEEQ